MVDEEKMCADCDEWTEDVPPEERKRLAHLFVLENPGWCPVLKWPVRRMDGCTPYEKAMELMEECLKDEREKEGS